MLRATFFLEADTQDHSQNCHVHLWVLICCRKLYWKCRWSCPSCRLQIFHQLLTAQLRIGRTNKVWNSSDRLSLLNRRLLEIRRVRLLWLCWVLKTAQASWLLAFCVPYLSRWPRYRMSCPDSWLFWPLPCRPWNRDLKPPSVLLGLFYFHFPLANVLLTLWLEECCSRRLVIPLVDAVAWISVWDTVQIR